MRRLVSGDLRRCGRPSDKRHVRDASGAVKGRLGGRSGPLTDRGAVRCLGAADGRLVVTLEWLR
jgi:hypothetical protein